MKNIKGITAVDTLVVHAVVVTMNEQLQILQDAAIAIQHGEIVDIGDSSSLTKKYIAKQCIEASGKIVMPGLINTHSHTAMTLFRGLADDLNLEDFLNRVWALESDVINLPNVELGNKLGIIEMMQSGISMAQDMYWYPEVMAQLANEIGFRCMTGPIFIEFAGCDGINNVEERLLGVRKFVEDYAGSEYVYSGLFPHGLYTLQPHELEKIQKLADELKLPLHIHAAESRGEIEAVKKRYGKTPVCVLNDFGMLNRNTVLAHAVHLTDDEIQMLADNQVSISHCILSNLKTASGIADIKKMLKAGINITLGTDGPTTGNDLNLWAVMRAVATVHKAVNDDPTLVSAEDVLRMVTINAARALGQDEVLGSLEIGKRADMLFIETKKPHLQPLHNVCSQLVYSVDKGDVDSLMINGRMQMQNRRMLNIDEDQVMVNIDDFMQHFPATGQMVC